MRDIQIKKYIARDIFGGGLYSYVVSETGE